MKATFGTKQPLKSLEFGTLLYDILPKGVYETPTVVYDNGLVKVTGGTFLFYDTDEDKSYAVRVEDVNLDHSGTATGNWIFISYTYSPASVAAPVLSDSDDSSTNYNKIRLGRLIQTNSGYTVDTSSMELCGAGYSIDDGIIEHISYSPLETGSKLLNATFKNKIVTDTGIVTISSVDTTSFSGLDATKAQYLYIDSTGSLKCADATVPRFGKLVIAEKTANQPFTLVRFPYRAEMTAWSLEITGHSTWSSVTKENTIYHDGADNTLTHYSTLSESSHIISLEGLIEAMVSHIGELERKVDNLTARLTYLENLKTYFAAQVTIPTAQELVTTPTATKVEIDNVETKSTGNVNIKGSVTVDPQTSSFGTASSPIHNLYVTTSLYTDQLFVTE